MSRRMLLSPSARAWLRENGFGEIRDENARLVERLADWESRLSEEMPSDYKDWHQNSKEEWPTVAALTIRNLRERVAESGEEIDALRAEVQRLTAELAARDAATEVPEIPSLPPKGMTHQRLPAKDEDHERLGFVDGWQECREWVRINARRTSVEVRKVIALQ